LAELVVEGVVASSLLIKVGLQYEEVVGLKAGVR
jgi:hypothetical protein